MHSYQHNIKTFNSATRHLTRVERSLYRDLIELYYDTEQPLPAANFDRLCRLVLANSEEEKTALQYVLDEFFVLTGDVYSHDYCDEQIEKYRQTHTAKAKAGLASADARRQRAEERRQERQAHDQQPLNTCPTSVANHKPVTSNQEPLKITTHSGECRDVVIHEKKTKNTFSAADLVSIGVDETIARDFMAVRKRKGAPLTETAMKGIVREAGVAGYTINQALQVCAERGWQSFKADWVTDKSTGRRISFFELATGQRPEF